MVISLFFVLWLGSLWRNTVSSKRQITVVWALLFYLFVTTLDLVFLEEILHRSFHFSDPSGYYESTHRLAFLDIFKKLDIGHAFYICINWYYNHIYDSTFVISMWIKVNNILVILTAYLLLTRKLKNFSWIDIILLFSPFLVLTIIRNVRDAYIILFLSMIMMGLKYNKDNQCGSITLVAGIALLAITRPILLVPFIIMFVLRGIQNHPWLKYPIMLCVSIGIYYFFFSIMDIILNQTMSALAYIDEKELVEELNVLFDHQYSLSTCLLLFKRLIVGGVALLFTPHPVNFISLWLENAEANGTMGIYTGVDNLLISLGSIYNYIFIIPLMLYYFFHYKKYGDNIFWFIVLYIIIYTTAYLGVTDIRNRHLAYFFILIALSYHNIGDKYSLTKFKKYYLVTLAIFVVIEALSDTV